MSNIVEKYIQFNEEFQKCAYKQFEGEFSFDDLKDYYIKLDDFVKSAKERYSNNHLDVSSAMNLFSSDVEAQSELKQYESNANDEVKKR